MKEKLVNIFFIFILLFLWVVHLKTSQLIPNCHISKFISFGNSQYIVKGIVDSEPAFKNNKMTFIFKAREIQSGEVNRSCCGNILVILRNEIPLAYGENLILNGRVNRPFSDSYRNYLANNGIYHIMRVNSEISVVRLNKNNGFIIKKISLQVADKIKQVIRQYSPGLSAGILEAMILGRRENIPWAINNMMVKTGTVHILVVSGFNVGIVAFVVMLLLKIFRIRKKIRIAIAIPILIVYCFATGASNPVVRATVMGIVFLISYLFKREPNIYRSLGLAALFILVINPLQIFDIGFQLSFASVWAIVFLYPKISTLLKIKALKIIWLRRIIEAALVSFSAWLGTMGLIAYYFRIFSPITVLANLFIVPLATLITLSGFSLVIIGIISPKIAPFFGLACEFFVSLLVVINALLLKIPGASFYFK